MFLNVHGHSDKINNIRWKLASITQIVLSTAVPFKPVKHCETSRRNAEELSPLLRDQHSHSTFQVSQECRASIQLSSWVAEVPPIVFDHSPYISGGRSQGATIRYTKL